MSQQIEKTSGRQDHAVARREGELFAQLQKVSREPLEAPKAEALFRIIASEYLGGAGAAHLKKTGKKWTATRSSITGQISPEEVTRSHLQTWFDQAVARNKDVRFRPDAKDPHQYLITPTAGENGSRSILLVKCRAGTNPDQIRSSSTMMQMIATFHDLVFAKESSATQRHLFESSAAVIELVTEIEESDSVQHACQRIVQETKRYLGSLTSCIGIGSGGHYATVANSDVVKLDRDSELFKFYENAWQEASLHDSVSVWPPGENDSRHGLIQHRKLVEKLRVAAVVSLPLTTEDDRVIGTLTLVGDEKDLCSESAINFLSCAGPRIASALELLQRAQQGAAQKFLRNLRDRSGRRKLAISIIAAVALGAILLYPIPYRVRCQCDTDALTRRYIAAPFDGVLQQGVVRAGDIVTQNQLLANMNGREIRQELARAKHDKHRAEKERDLYLAEERIADSLLADLEARQLDITTKLLESRESQLTITSPIDGIVLNGDLDRANNMPVQLGETLYEIGSLELIKLKLAIPSDEISHVGPGMCVRVWLSGWGSDAIDGQVERILPDAEIRENQNVFIAEVILPNADQRLKPGMQGTAIIVSDSRSLGWNLFHKPIEYVASRISW